MHNLVIFDTETTSINKPFCYNIGYTIITPDGQELVRREYVIEQVWHNLPLFNTAYYAEKRPLYINRLRVRDDITMEKYGYVTQKMARDFKKYDVGAAYAYNSSFDDRVFQFNCDWFKVINPFDNIPIFDIRGLVHQFIATTDAFLAFCEDHSCFTESGNYSTTAETLFQFITNNSEFTEDHTALSDALIEAKILMNCVERGGELFRAYDTKASIVRLIPKPFTIKVNGKVLYQGIYTKKYVRLDTYNFTVADN